MPEIRPFTFPSTIGLSEGVVGSDVEKLQEFLQHFGYLRIASASEEFSAVRTAANPPIASCQQRHCRRIRDKLVY